MKTSKAKGVEIDRDNTIETKIKEMDNESIPSVKSKGLNMKNNEEVREYEEAPNSVAETDKNDTISRGSEEQENNDIGQNSGLSYLFVNGPSSFLTATNMEIKNGELSNFNELALFSIKTEKV